MLICKLPVRANFIAFYTAKPKRKSALMWKSFQSIQHKSADELSVKVYTTELKKQNQSIIEREMGLYKLIVNF